MYNKDYLDGKREILIDIIKDHDEIMLTTISLNGNLVSRPMAMQELEFDGDLWFMTSTKSAKFDEIKANPKVNVAFSGDSYASVAGKAIIVDDVQRKKEFWNKFYEGLFGVEYDDPSLVLIKVVAETAEYWETGNKTKSVFNFVKQVIGNDNVEGEDDVNASLEL